MFLSLVYLKKEFKVTSEMNTPSKPYIESLPDELWLQIFAYTPTHDLYSAWYNLNSRINSILCSLYISIYITNKNQENIYYKNIVNHFSSQLVSIRNEYTSTFRIDLSSCINVRSLYLDSCSKIQFEQILNLHQLTYLSLPCDSVGGDFFKKYLLGKDQEKYFPNLRSVGRILSCYIDDSVTVNRNIQHVHLVAIRIESTPVKFLKYLPGLRLITVNYLANDCAADPCLIAAKIRHENNTDFNEIFSSVNLSGREKNSHLYAMAQHIYQLKIDFYGHCNFTKLAFLLQQCSILEKVRIRIKYYRNDLDLPSIRSLNPFLSTLTFGDIQKDTGKPILITI